MPDDGMKLTDWEKSELVAEVKRLRKGLADMKQEAFELVRDDPSVSTQLLHFVGSWVDDLLGDEVD